MTNANSSLLLHVYAPPLTDEDSRPRAIVEAMEGEMPGLRLAWNIGDQGDFIAAAEGSARRIARDRDGGFALYCNGNNDHLVTVSGVEVPALLCPGRQPQLMVYSEWPMDPTNIAIAPNLLEAVAGVARSFWADVTPSSAMLGIAAQSFPGMAGQRSRGLPVLKREASRVPEMPAYVGWLNYWSAATANAIGFPDSARDAELLARSRRTEAGGWVVRLTDAPLDLDNPAHLQALLRAYERFPRIGGRAP